MKMARRSFAIGIAAMFVFVSALGGLLVQEVLGGASVSALASASTIAPVPRTRSALAAQEAGESIELTYGVELNVLASEQLDLRDELPDPDVGGWGLAFEKISLEPGESKSLEPMSSDAEIHLLYVDDGEPAIVDGDDEAPLTRGESLLRVGETGYEVRNNTGRCGSLLRLTVYVYHGGGPFSSGVSGPALPTVACGHSAPSVGWSTSVDDLPQPVRLVMARFSIESVGGPVEFISDFTGPVVLQVESGTLRMVGPDGTYYLAQGSTALMTPDSVNFISSGSTEPVAALVVGVAPNGRGLAEPDEGAPAPATAEPELDSGADLADLLPTEDQVPPGLVRTEDVERTLEEVATNYDDPGGTEQQFAAWGWEGNVVRRFAAPDAPGLSPGSTTSVYISIHRFGSDAAAAEALAYSFGDQAAATNAQEVAIDSIGDEARALVVRTPGHNEITIYARTTGLLIRVSAGSETGDPTADAQTVVEAILASVG